MNLARKIKTKAAVVILSVITAISLPGISTAHAAADEESPVLYLRSAIR